MRQAFRRVAVAPQAQAKTRTKKFPAPVRGWIANENLAAPLPSGAGILINWFPTSTGIRLRKGSVKINEVASGAALSMFTYVGGAGEKLFVSDATKILEISNAMHADVVGQTSGYYATAQFGTVGNDFLYAVNGTDSALLYDGTAWMPINGTSTPSITGVETSTFSHVWTYKNRLFFVQKGSRSAWCLPVDSIGGAAIEISLAGVFQEGGSLLFGATWSLDAGNGPDEKCVFVSTKGEVAVFQGSDPSVSTSWGIVGRYYLTRPLGQRATMRAGGDLLIATEVGLIPISQAVAKDVAALSLASVSRGIETEWQLEAVARQSGPWEILKWPGKKCAIVSMPMLSTETPYCFVVNLETGAWTKYAGWDPHCMALYNGDAYFGTADGRIMQMEVGSTDDGSGYYCDYTGLFDDLDAASATKVMRLGRATFRAVTPIISQLGAAFDYRNVTPSFPQGTPSSEVSGQWNTAIWDQSTWDAGGNKKISTRWLGIAGVGFVVAPSVRVLVNGGAAPDGELISTEYTYEVGGVVV